MKRLVLVALFVGALTAPASAQDTTAAMLRRARDLYEQLELERALPLLRQVISPGWSYDVSASQRVEANLYLGAALVLLGSTDSATTHFRAALERDPFADLDPARFTPAQVSAFQVARRAVFRIGVRPVTATRLDPRTGRMAFTVVATHAAAVRCEIRALEPAIAFPLFVGDIEGLRDIEWDGVLANGQLAPSGRYAVVLIAQSRLRSGPGGGADSASAYFDVQQELPGALEDTLPDLQPHELLPERYEKSAGTTDLLKGLGVAAGAFLLSGISSHRGLGESQTMAAVVATAGVTVGVGSFLTRRGGSRPENIAANDRQRAQRAATNQQIVQRNAERRAQTVLLIRPAAGAAP